ncbi:RNA-directed DNA polymerase from transposon X-element [Paramuricea clavata]|uniref:thiopurine S-methyltransferase n=1 Tax=Paramuricea clavata TaxID=317549 RepID=A0A6S7G3G7_PARCT|nr:RNA-directed DNA polymerase from transposon X-element [Paramuricea clavata]
MPYLSNRTQRVVINGSHSMDFPLLHGVPQGSYLGPLLFILYSSKLFDVIKNHLPDAHAYVDDTQLYISFKPDSTACELEAVTALQNCIADIKTWMTVDKLKLNEDKTEFLIIGSRTQLEKIKITELRIGQVMVLSVSNARNLGSWFDNILKLLTDGKQNRRILVPFCGKSLDLLWLVKQGHTVIGIEIIQKAIDDFFKENNIAHVKNTIDGNGHCYMAFDGKLKIFDCDYFKFNSSLAGGKVDAIWDCNALGAISPHYWAEYLHISLEILDVRHGRILLQACLYDQDEFPGPPYSVPKEELSRLLGDSYELELLNRKPAEELRARFGLSWVYETLTSIKNKS